MAGDNEFIRAEEEADDLAGALLNIFNDVAFFQEDTACCLGIGGVPVSEDIRERRRCRHDMVQGKVAHSFDRILVNGFTVKISIFSRSYTASKIMPGLADDDDGRRRRIGWLSLQFALV